MSIDSLDLAESDFRKVQQLGRYADPRTILVYEDNKNHTQFLFIVTMPSLHKFEA